MRRLGELLVAKGKLSDDQLQKALQAQMIWGGHLGTNLIELGYITEDELGEVLAEAHSVGYATYEMLQEIPSTVLNAIPKGLVEKYKIVPFLFDGKKLHMVMLRPTDLMALDEVSFATGFQLVPYVTPEIRLFQILEKHYNIPRARRYITLSRELASRAAGKKGRPAGKPPAGRSAGPEDKARPASSILSSPQPGAAGAGSEAASPATQPPAEGPRAGGASGASVPEHEADPYAESSAMDWIPSQESTPADRTGKPKSEEKSELVPTPLPEANSRARTDAGLDSLLRAKTLEEVCQALTEEAAGAFRRCAVFARSADEFIAIAALSATTESWAIDGLALPFDVETAEAIFGSGRTYYIAAPPGERTHASFYRRLGGNMPPNVFMAPVRLADRIALIFYGDQGSEEIRPREIESVLNMVHQAGLALDLLQLRRKDSPE